jgi:MoaA/NifB/PqqE/SkfB family radical SAM enzyme
MARSIVDKARDTVASYQKLLLEPPTPTKIKRFLIAVNGWCNSRCTFCNIWKYDKALALREEITLDELERNVFSSSVLADALNIGITGGEPFLRRDIVQVYQSMCRHFRQAHIGAVTNGLKPDRIAAVIVEVARTNPARSFSLLISLDGYGETHDRVRGVPGNFAKVVETVRQLQAAAPDVLLGFSHTVTPTNMQDSLRCYELARELGIGFMYRLAHEAPYLRNEGLPIWSPETLEAVEPVVDELNRRMLHDQSLLSRLSNSNYASIEFYSSMLDYFENPRRTFDCYSGTHSFLLNHDGEVAPCINLPVSMGNVRRQTFDEIWFSAQAQKVREPIANWQCHCWTNCETEFSLARNKPTFVRSAGRNLRSLAG